MSTGNDCNPDEGIQIESCQIGECPCIHDGQTMSPGERLETNCQVW